jgi:hypothetical protein
VSAIDEIKKLEERLREAELGPDPEFFRAILADDAVLDGQRLKQKVVDAHRPGRGPKFDRVEMSDYALVDHGDTVVVTCTGRYEGSAWSGTLNFMRVWHRRDRGWQIIAATTSRPEA